MKTISTPVTDSGNVAASRLAPRKRGVSGASLVEVLIVLTIILIGVFIAIQIFPIGFTSLKRDEARLRADRYARNVTETLLSDQGALPEAISFSYYVGGNLQTVTDVDPDNLATYGDTDAEIAQNKLYFSDVNKFRYVQNEPVAVPLATATGDSGLGGGIGSVHFLTFGPVYMNDIVGNPANKPITPAEVDQYNAYLKVTSEKLIGTPIESVNQREDARYPTVELPSRFGRVANSPNKYAIDYGDQDNHKTPADEVPVILFARSTVDRTFNVTFTYQDESGANVEVKTGTCKLTVPANTFAFVPLFDDDKNDDGTNIIEDLNKKTIDAGSEIVTRNFTRLTTADPWIVDDPYQYKLVSPQIAPGASANLGVIAFNPVGANFSVSVPGGVKPFTALVSYAVLDWHILHDDREVPANGVVRTTLPNIRPRGDDTTDVTATPANRTQYYPGLYPSQPFYNDVNTIPNVAESPDIQVFNLSDASGTAKPLNSYDASDPGSTPGDYRNFATDSALPLTDQPYFWINRSRTGGTYPTGGIYINTNRVKVGSKVRILYKAQGDWAVAFQKAARAYRQQEATGGQVPVAGDANVFAISRNGTATDFSDDRVVFHRSEINKGVTATVEITTGGTGVNRRITRLPVRQFSIQNADGQYAYANLSEIATEIKSGMYGGASITDTRIVGNISGVSLKTRVVWQDEQNGRSKFHVSDLETFVSRQAQ